jgi:hypothetical protein
MVTGDLAQSFALQQVGARITDLCDNEPIFLNDCRGKRGTHARPAQALLGALNDDIVCLGYRSAQRLGVRAVYQRFLEYADGKFACDFSGGMAAHTVGYHVKRGLHEQRVLVMIAHLSDVGT